MHSKINVAGEIGFQIEVLRAQLYKIRNNESFIIKVFFTDSVFWINNRVGCHSSYHPNNFLED